MRSLKSFLVLILSFIPFVASGPPHFNSHSSRLARNPISSRQFHHPRALEDVCADVNLSLLLTNVAGLNLGSLLGNICLCLSAFPLNLNGDANLQLLVKELGLTNAHDLLEKNVKDSGTKCVYPDHTTPKCTSGNVCGFTCVDGFVKSGVSCVCSPPNSVCNGKCGAYPKGCSSALPVAPKMTRRRIVSSRKRAASDSHSRALLAVDDNVNLNSSGLLSDLLSSLGIPSSDSGIGIDINTLVNQILNSLNISVPISGGTQSTNLKATLVTCVGASVSKNLLDPTTKIVNSLLSLLLGTTVNLGIDLSCSSPTDPDTMSLDLQLCGSSGDSLEAILTSALKEVETILNGALLESKIVTSCDVNGSECPATPTLSNSNMPPPSPLVPVLIHDPSVSPSSFPTLNGVNLGGPVDGLLGQVEKILADLGLNTVNYALDIAVDPIVGVSVGLGDTLSNVDGLVDTISVLVKETLDTLLGIDLTVQTNPFPSPAPSGFIQANGIVVDVDLSAPLNGTLSKTRSIVDGVLLGVSEVLVILLNFDVIVNVDGGSGCGCNGSRSASAKS